MEGSRILIVAATHAEVAPLVRTLGAQVPVLVTGVGPAATGFALGRAFAQEAYRFAINLGIAGSFRSEWPLGTVVEVTQDCFADLGAQDHERFLSAQELGLIDANAAPYERGLLHPLGGPRPACLDQLPAAAGITVSTAHGHQPSIDAVRARLAPDIESMEGAAFFYACRMAGVPCVQVRAISNYVTPRDRAAWDIPLAIASLNSFAAWIIEDLLHTEVPA